MKGREMNKSYFFSILLSGTFICAPNLANAEENQMFGNWARSDGIAHVAISKCGQDYCAKNIWIKPNWKTEKVGDVLIMKINTKGAGHYSGIAYDPQRKMNYNFKLNVAGNKMITKGCVLGGLLCKSVSWKRI
jgi:uncharacterized protein (DUF2147 family)